MEGGIDSLRYHFQADKHIHKPRTTASGLKPPTTSMCLPIPDDIHPSHYTCAAISVCMSVYKSLARSAWLALLLQ